MNIENPGNLINDRLQFDGQAYDVLSPMTGEIIATVPCLDEAQINNAVEGLNRTPTRISREAVFGFLQRLKSQCEQNRQQLLDINQLETGFIAHENAEVIDAVIEYLEDFPTYIEQMQTPEPPLIKHSYATRIERQMRLIKRPYKCVAALVPQNASIGLAVITIASALYVGSKVIVRPSLQCGASGALLAKLIADSQPPANMISIVNCKAKDFLNACYQTPVVDLIHYIGSDRYARAVLHDSFVNGKTALIDGEGNSMVFVDDSFPLAEAADMITEGVIRYNGATCTSINGVLVSHERYDAFQQALKERFSALKFGHPAAADTNVGPLFSPQQATVIQDTIAAARKARIIAGGNSDGAYLEPTLVVDAHIDDPMVKEGFFGPAVWLAAINKDELPKWLDNNRFPLCDSILSHDKEQIQDFVRQSRAARICINQDSSIESMYEPWGGYAPGGSNPVSIWTDKYLQTIQLDGTIADIT